METPNLFSRGTVISSEFTGSIEALKWAPHPSFHGVYMKTLLGGLETAGRMSCHLVSIDPGCAIGDHAHEGRMELHEIIAGNGNCNIGGKVVAYTAGIVSYIPQDVNQSVEAGDAGLFFLAKFSPALV